MDYNEFVTQQFIPRVSGLLNGLRGGLVTAGVPSSGITVTEVNTEGVNDLRWRIVARRGARTLTAYVELTAGGVVNGQMAISVTLWVDGNGNQINTSYTANLPVQYNDPAALDALVAKIAALEGMSTGELLTAARAFLQV